jgi:lysyl-tRNA synthetase class 1
MSSSSGNTIGPIEALELVPPQILRLLIAKSKPNKAIDFDTGMGLVTLADEFERLSARDFQQELAQDGLSRRQKVQIEDAAGAMKMAAVTSGIEVEATAVTFRHLALLAQTKNSDEAVWSSLQSSGAIQEVTSQMQDRLNRMRHWIQSSHFPEEMRINILSQPNAKMLQELNEVERQILMELVVTLNACEWNSDGIGASIPQSAKNLEQSPRSAFKVAYAAFMGVERGPRLAPILAEMNRDEILALLDACVQVLDE